MDLATLSAMGWSISCEQQRWNTGWLGKFSGIWSSNWYTSALPVHCSKNPQLSNPSKKLPPIYPGRKKGGWLTCETVQMYDTRMVRPDQFLVLESEVGRLVSTIIRSESHIFQFFCDPEKKPINSNFMVPTQFSFLILTIQARWMTSTYFWKKALDLVNFSKSWNR